MINFDALFKALLLVGLSIGWVLGLVFLWEIGLGFVSIILMLSFTVGVAYLAFDN